MANVLVFAETRGTALRKVALEAVTAARALADATGGGEVHALVAGPSGVGGVAEQLGKHGADVVLVVEHPVLATFERESIAATVADRAKQGGFRAVVLGFSTQGRDLGPRLAARLDAPIGADLMSGWIEDGTAARIAEWKRHEGAARQIMAKRLLAGERYQTHPLSHHIWLSLPPRWSSDGFVAQARSRGVVLNASSEFAVGDQHPKAVRLCLGTPRTRAGLEQALTRVAECLNDRSPAARAVV